MQNVNLSVLFLSTTIPLWVGIVLRLAALVIGVLVALIAARIMKSTLFKGDGEVYLMELPPYRMPSFKSLMLHMWDRGRMYLQKAGTIILLTSVILLFGLAVGY